MRVNRNAVWTTAVAALLALLPGSGAVAQTAAGEPEAWRASRPEPPAAVLVRGATIWTSGPEGRLENADLLVRKGKIASVGPGLEAPADAVVIEAGGKHVTPGLIDAHSHSAIVGGVNEGRQTVSSEVRIEDVLNSEDINLYRQLAGGLTAANLLHGSANAIGGQSCVIKLRYGSPPEGLELEDRVPGIKFALGENPKRANWGTQDDHYPVTRSGVAALIRERFLAARDYAAAWKRWEQEGKRGTYPRRDLELEALVEILDGKRQIHCHSYRQDEILMLMRLGEELGFRVGTFQHILEGYKVADEMREHGAHGSGFSDWWAYKFEVYDAIPYSGAVMWDRGVLVSFNSDSGELARRMNLEAAKAVKYGGVPEEEALKFVTLNPAIQLGVGDRIGSLEPGKDADFVVWSGHPLSTYTLCEQTWVDGAKYFDRAEDLAARASLEAERADLIAKIQDAKKEDGKKQPGAEPTTASGDPGYQEYRAPEYAADDGGDGVCRCAALDHQDAGCTHRRDAARSILERLTEGGR
jgi:imidazolonepropionase-like amidohydrolase